MKQSLRLWLPKLNPQMGMKNFLTRNSQHQTLNFICHCQSPNIPSLKSLYKPGEGATIMIGPEGDFTPEEIGLAEATGFTAVTLGSNRLRTETAGIVVVHTVKLLNG
jgi:16S rRNA (uracil1498-N3)-methyltransferase